MILVPLSPRNSTFGDVHHGSRQEILIFLGPVLIGALCNWLLLGVLTMQLYVYYLCFPSDYWWIKLSAYVLYLLELGQTVLVTKIAWVYLCAGWGIESTLMHIDWGFSMAPIANGLIACWAQTYFAWRVSSLGHNKFWKLVAVLILVLAVAHVCIAVLSGVKLHAIPHGNLLGGSTLLVEVQNLFYVCLSAGAVSDFMIAVSMLYFFITTKRRMAWSKNFDRRITNLIRSAFETGALCSATAFIDLVTFVRFGHNFVHIAIVMVLSKLYSNALMSSLNSRAGVYEQFSMSNSGEEGHTTTGRVHATQFTSVGIPVTTRTDDFMWVDGRGGQSTDSTQDSFEKGRTTHTSAAFSSDFGRA